MKKGSFLNSISALVLLAFAVIWIINICVGNNNMTDKVKQGIGTAHIVIFICIFVVYVFGDKSLPSGLTWLICLIGLLYLPTLATSFMLIFGVDLTAFLVFAKILAITQAVVYIPFYMIIVWR